MLEIQFQLCRLYLYLYRLVVFISTQPTKLRRPYAALTLDTIACVHRYCSAGDWCLGEIISSALHQVLAPKLPKSGLNSLSCRLPGRRCREGQGGCDGGPPLASSLLFALLARPQPTCLPNQSAQPGQGMSKFCIYVDTVEFLGDITKPPVQVFVSRSVNLFLEKFQF